MEGTKNTHKSRVHDMPCSFLKTWGKAIRARGALARHGKDGVEGASFAVNGMSRLVGRMEGGYKSW